MLLSLKILNLFLFNYSQIYIRHCLWIVGDRATLSKSESIWKKMVNDAEARGCLFPAEDHQLYRRNKPNMQNDFKIVHDDDARIASDFSQLSIKNENMKTSDEHEHHAVMTELGTTANMAEEDAVNLRSSVWQKILCRKKS